MRYAACGFPKCVVRDDGDPQVSMPEFRENSGTS